MCRCFIQISKLIRILFYTLFIVLLIRFLVCQSVSIGIAIDNISTALMCQEKVTSKQPVTPCHYSNIQTRYNLSKFDLRLDRRREFTTSRGRILKLNGITCSKRNFKSGLGTSYSYSCTHKMGFLLPKGQQCARVRLARRSLLFM